MVSASSPTAAANVSIPTGPPSNLLIIALRMARSIWSKPQPSISSSSSAPNVTSRVTTGAACTSAKSRTRRSSRLAIRGVPRARRQFGRPRRIDTHCEQLGRTLNDLSQFLMTIKIQVVVLAEAVAQRGTQQTRAGGSTYQGKRLDRQLHRAGSRPLAHHQVELEILHGRIEDFLHD